MNGNMMVSPTEPFNIGKLSRLPEKHGCDYLIIRKRIFGVQRKQFPEDFIASLYDGRLQREIIQMRSVSHASLLLEGIPRWNCDGVLLHEHVTLTYQQLMGILWSVQARGIATHWTRDAEETVKWLELWQKWISNDDHTSLLRKPRDKGTMFLSQKTDKQVFFLQGIDGIGVHTARRIIEHFGLVPLEWRFDGKDLTVDDLCSIPEIGQVRAKKLLGFFKELNRVKK